MDKAHIGKVDMGREYNLLQAEEEFTAPMASILAVDDNRMNLELLRGMLKNTKIHVDTANDGREALEKLRVNTYNIVFLDHMMPVMDGMVTLRHIKEENLCKDTVIIVLTANAVAGVKDEYLAAGFDGYLSKPVVSKQLYTAIKKHLPKELIVVKEKQEAAENNVAPEAETTNTLVSKLAFLDTATGMSYCMDSEEFYQEMLEAYIESDKLEDIDAYYKAKDWKNYRIQVHALKSTSLTIGAINLSEHARALETAAKKEDADYIEAHNEEVVTEYKEILANIKAAIKVPEKEIEVSDGYAGDDKAHILVVDDDIMNLKIAAKMLGEKFRVDCVESGRAALQFLEKEQPNLILLDLHMPDMDGFEVLSIIKGKEDIKDIPVIFLTADNDRETEVKGFQAGALDFITKPFIADIMMQRVNRLLELNRLQKYLQQEVTKQTKRARDRREKVERLSVQIMRTLASTIDAKDKYTNGHSERVAMYSKEIARRMGKSVKEQEDIYFMGLLHDIGKIGIPDEIINKTSKLTDEEYAVIKTHPVIGADILKNISEMRDLATGAHWHHERYDGKGYPDNKQAEDIPEVARIIGVADAYDAMTSKRSYRDTLSQETVRGEIEKGRGTQFDPQFADKMLEMISEDKDYSMREV